MFESVPIDGKVVLMFLIKNDVDLIHVSGSFKNDINCLCEEFMNILFEQIAYYLQFTKDQE